MFGEKLDLTGTVKRSIKGIRKQNKSNKPRGAICPHDWVPMEALSFKLLTLRDIKALTLLTIA
jgi:hypothetical protein